MRGPIVRLLLVVPATALVALGAEGLYHALAGRERIAIDCAEFTRTRPPSHRVAITGCEIDYASAGFAESDGQVQELFLPARAAGSSGPAPLVVATRDPAVLAIARDLLTTPTAGNTATTTVRNAAATLGISVAIDGLVRAGFVERLRTRRVLSGMTSVAPDAVVLDANARPDFLRPLLALSAGILLGILAFDRRRLAKSHGVQTAQISAMQAPVAAEPPEGQRGEMPMVPPASGAAVPRLLLLDLQVSAGPDAVETAPPLGSRQQVRAILIGIVPDLQPRGGHRLLSRHDDSLRLDLGDRDPVATVVADARGEAGVALLQEVLRATGWRAFAPKTGLFVTIDELAMLGALAADQARTTVAGAASPEASEAS